jgi:PleD family two-component response regulator
MNPAGGLRPASQERYDLILLDLQMPVMDGFAVMEGLKTNTSDSYLPVIVLTAQPGHKLRALQSGAKDFISKPFDWWRSRRAFTTCWKCACCTKKWSELQQGTGRRPCKSARPSCARARRATAA